MKTRYWVIILVIIAIVAIGIVLFMYGYLPRPFFSGGKYRAINQYEIFRDLLIIVLTLAGLTIALFGIGVYLLLRGRIEDIARKEAKKESDEVQADVTQRLVVQFIKIAIALARQNWKTIKTQTISEDQEAKRKDLQNWSIRALNDALTFTERALPVAKNKNFWENPENKKYLINLKNNLAFYMACRKDNKNREDARRYAGEIEKEIRLQSIPNYHYLDTIAWVFRQFALSDKDVKKSEALVLELTNRKDIPDEDRDGLLEKYAESSKTPKT